MEAEQFAVVTAGILGEFNRCQWRAKIAQFWQSKISHLERAVVPPVAV